METQLQREEKEKLISECLKLKFKLKRLKRKWRLIKKRNLNIKQHNRMLNDKIVGLRKQSPLKNGDYLKVMEVNKCRVVLKEDNLESTVQQTNNRATSRDERFKCQHPGFEKIYGKRIQLNIHLIMHAKKYQCQVCQKCCYSQTNLENHLRIHTSERPFKCDWAGCGKKFKRKDHLKLHIFSEHSDNSPFQCKENGCGKTFKTISKLNKHVKSHSSIRSFQCQVEGCDKSFKYKETLKQHIKVIHTESIIKRAFQCDKNGCGKLFAQQFQLKEHMNIHFTWRQFQCQECGKRFKQKSALIGHVKSVHSDVKRFRCNVENCQKAYTSRSNLNIHRQKIHEL